MAFVVTVFLDEGQIWQESGVNAYDLAEEVYEVWKDGMLDKIVHPNGVELSVPYVHDDGTDIDDGNFIIKMVEEWLLKQDDVYVKVSREVLQKWHDLLEEWDDNRTLGIQDEMYETLSEAD